MVISVLGSQDDQEGLFLQAYTARFGLQVISNALEPLHSEETLKIWRDVEQGT